MRLVDRPDTDAEARRLFTSAQQQFANLILGPLPTPIDDIEVYWTTTEKTHVTDMLACFLVGRSAASRSSS